MTKINVHIVPVLSDNYVYILEGADQKAAIVDPGEAGPVRNYLEDNNLKPEIILLTHHHGDHVAGTDTLRQDYGCDIYGPAKDADRLPALDKPLDHQDSFNLFGQNVDVIETPGHTKHHICYYIADSDILLAGDTLFSIGCGRVFEGTMEQMHNSLQFLKQLPDETKIYCGHEYTLSNLKFALSLNPDDKNLVQKMERVQQKRDRGEPTMPAAMGEENRLNPFLRAENVEEFVDIRRKKDAA